MKIRIKFSKTGHLKYIGHLDVMRCFQKVMRRAEVDIAYSAGFSPHQIMSFASPLGLGLTSEGEYVDIEVHSTRSSAEMLQRINAVMVEGMEALSYVKLPDTAKNAMSAVAAADYVVTFDEPVSCELCGRLQDFLDQDSIVITKKTKKREMELDIRPLIYRKRVERAEYPWAVRESGEQTRLFLRVASGSAMNLKPEQVMDAFFGCFKVSKELLPYHVHRTELYANLAKEGEEPEWVSLEGLGEAIV